MLASGLVISELVATGSSLRDADGDPSDWIEIHNPTDRAIGLDGWSLTDDPNDLTKWQFPFVNIAPAGYQTVFASGKDRADESYQLRRDFNGTKNGTFLVDLDHGVYDIRLTTGDTERARDEMIVSIQGQPNEPLATAAGEFLVKTYRAEVNVATGGQLAIQITDTGGQTVQSVINALVISPAGEGVSRWFDFGMTGSPVEPGFTRVTAADTYSPAVGYGWQAGDKVTEKNRDMAPTELHTNFKLKSAGEYLALVEPDGSTVAYQYAPQYPPQQLGTSYGLEQGGMESTPIAAGAAVAVLVPTSTNGGLDLGTSWTEVGFDDSNWTRGTTGVGYERGQELDALIATDVQDAMFGVNASAYLRIPFSVDRADRVYSLRLRMKYDDGYVAYVNGTEVARANAPKWVHPDSKAAKPRADSMALEFEDVDLTAFVSLLHSGPNVLAIQMLNRSAADEDVLIVPELHVGSSSAIESATGGYFATPTPSGPNGLVSFAGLTAAPTVGGASGLFDSPFEVQVTSTAPGATLVFTTDGSQPARDHGVRVVAPSTTVPISQTTVLRAAAFGEDSMLSPVVIRTYIFPADVAGQDFQATVDAGFPSAWGTVAPDYGLDPRVVGPGDLFNGVYAGQLGDSLKAVPTLSIVMDADDLFDPDHGIYSNPTMSGSAWERPTSIELIYPDGQAGFQVDAGIRIMGAFSRKASKKKSFRLAFRSQYGPTKLRFPLFGDQAADQFNTIALRANFNDSWTWTAGSTQYIRDQWTRSVQLAMGQPSGHGTFMHVYINGVYWGLYNPVERPDASFAATYLGGDADNWDAISAGSAVDGTNETWLELLSRATDVGVADQQVSNAALLRLLGKNPDGTDNPEYETLLDVDNYIDYMILNFFTGNTDWPKKNFRAARMRGPESTGFKFFSWDAERALNDEEGANVNVDVTARRVGVAAILSSCLRNDEFRLLFADHVHRHFFDGGVFYVDPENPVWDPAHPQRNVPATSYKQLADQVALPLVAESARWGDARRTEMPLTVADWQALIDEMLESWFPQRAGIVLNQLTNRDLYPRVAAPEFSQHGGQVVPGFELTISAPGEIYYTLDGSDPRDGLFHRTGETLGAISASAHKYEGPVAINGATVVKARTLLDGQWSALDEATFLVGPLPLRVSEIMYHPQNPDPGSPFEDDDFEYIELVNISDTVPIDLENVSFTEGIEFTFPARALGPGQRVLVVRNESAMNARYGQGLPIVGQYGNGAGGFKLDNGGERIRLEDNTGALIQEFIYDDAWHERTDGLGYSLEMVNAAGRDLEDWGRGQAWLPSIEVGGTPGYARAHAELTPGDLDLSGQVDLEDIDDFVLAFSSPARYRAKYGVPPSLGGDVDGDGDLDVDDIAEFVALLSAREERVAQGAHPVRHVRQARHGADRPRRTDARAHEAVFTSKGHTRRRHAKERRRPLAADAADHVLRSLARRRPAVIESSLGGVNGWL